MLYLTVSLIDITKLMGQMGGLRDLLIAHGR